MIIENQSKLRKRVFKRVNRRGEPREYRMVFVTFSKKFTPILQRFKELHNIEIVADDEKVVLPTVNLYVNSYYHNKKTGERVPQYSFTIPVIIAERLLEKGVRKVRVLAEVPE